MYELFLSLVPAAAAESAEAAQADPTLWQTILENASKLGSTGWITLFTILVLSAVMIGVSVSRKKWNAKSMAYAAMSVALAFVLSYIKVYRMPNSGSVTLASMLPLMIFSAAFGVGPGLMAGAVDGLLQYLQGGYFVHPVQFLLDYVLAYGLVGLAGLYRYLPKVWGKWRLFLAMIIGAAARAVSATLAGVFFWDTALWPSMVYNGAYLIPDTIICIFVAFFVGERLLREMRKGL